MSLIYDQAYRPGWPYPTYRGWRSHRTPFNSTHYCLCLNSPNHERGVPGLTYAPQRRNNRWYSYHPRKDPLASSRQFFKSEKTTPPQINRWNFHV